MTDNDYFNNSNLSAPYLTVPATTRSARANWCDKQQFPILFRVLYLWSNPAGACHVRLLLERSTRRVWPIWLATVWQLSRHPHE